MIPTVKEPKEFYEEFRVHECCYFCKQPTDTWHWRTNQPVCTDCAKVHKVAELPKCTPKYKVPTKEQYLNG
jgi:hypothetical protein